MAVNGPVLPHAMGIRSLDVVRLRSAARDPWKSVRTFRSGHTQQPDLASTNKAGTHSRSVNFADGRRCARLRPRAVAAAVTRVRIAGSSLTFSPCSPGFLYLLTLWRSAPVVPNRACGAGAAAAAPAPRESRGGDGGRSRDQDSGDEFGVHDVAPIERVSAFERGCGRNQNFALQHR